MKKKFTLIALGTLCIAMLLTACGKDKTPSNTPTPSESNPPVEDVITLPEDNTNDEPQDVNSNTEAPDTNVDEPVIEDPEVNTDTPVALEDLSYSVPNTDIEITLPESWRGNYYVKEVTYDDSIYPSLEFYYLGKDAETFGTNNAMMFMSVSSKEGLIDDLGEDFISAMGPNARNLGEYIVANESNELDTYVVILNWPEHGDVVMPEDYVSMVTDSQDENLIYCYIPEPVIVDEEAKPFVEAIEGARSEEENKVLPVVANMEQNLMYLDVLRLNAEDVEAFAISTSLMNIKAYNVSIIKPVEGHEDAVKAALEEYVAATVQSFENYLVDQLEIAQNAIIEEVNGNYVIVMCKDAQTVFDSIKTSLTA